MMMLLDDVLESWCRAHPIEALCGLPAELTLTIDVSPAGIRAKTI